MTLSAFRNLTSWAVFVYWLLNDFTVQYKNISSMLPTIQMRVHYTVMN